MRLLSLLLCSCCSERGAAGARPSRGPSARRRRPSPLQTRTRPQPRSPATPPGEAPVSARNAMHATRRLLDAALDVSVLSRLGRFLPPAISLLPASLLACLQRSSLGSPAQVPCSLLNRHGLPCLSPHTSETFNGNRLASETRSKRRRGKAVTLFWGFLPTPARRCAGPSPASLRRALSGRPCARQALFSQCSQLLPPANPLPIHFFI